MEVELKYSIADEATAEKLWVDEMLTSCEEEDSREKVPMKSAYFDTENFTLSENDIAFRVRKEGSRIVASLKWGGKNDGALHQRQEINVPVDDEACFLAPAPDLFKESEIGQHVIELIGDQMLNCIMEMNYIRGRFRIDKNDSIMEVSIDQGEIVTDKGKKPISELEVELFSGEESELLAIGDEISAKYGLEAGLSSKFSRGLDMLGIKIGK